MIDLIIGLAIAFVLGAGAFVLYHKMWRYGKREGIVKGNYDSDIT